MQARLASLYQVLHRTEQKLQAIKTGGFGASFAGGAQKLTDETQRLRREITQLESAVARLDRSRANALERLAGGVRAPGRALGAGLGGRGGPSGRREAAVRTAFNSANIVQDLAQAGPYAVANNLIQPFFWKDLATAMGGAKAVMGGVGTAVIGVGAAILTVGNGLKQAGLEWKDLGEVLSNLAPIEAASEAVAGIGLVVNDTFGPVGSRLQGWAGDLAQYTLGWRDATEAIRLHNEMAAQSATIQSGVTAANEKFKSKEQLAQQSRGNAFAQALADLGGASGIAGIQAKLGKGSGGLVVDAVAGKSHQQRMVANLLGQMGLDTSGLDVAMGGQRGVGLNEIVEMVKDENEAFAENKQAKDMESQRARALTDEGRENMDEARKAAAAGVEFGAERVQAGVLRRLGDGMGLDQAADQVKANFARALGDQLSPEDAKAASESFVDEQVNALRGDAAREKLANPESGQLRMLGIQSAIMGMGMGGLSEGPRTIAAGAFAQTVQDGQRPIAERLAEQIELQRRQIDLLESIRESARNTGLVGP